MRLLSVLISALLGVELSLTLSRPATHHMIRNKRDASSSLGFWPNKTVPYAIDNSYNEKQKNMIRQAVKTFVDNTCVEFKEDGPGGKIMFKPIERCVSWVGYMEWDSQPLDLVDNCFDLTTIQHEITHALGFYHTECRSDRDDYITLTEKMRDFFQKGSEPNYVPYEYGSIVHYGYSGSVQPKDKHWIGTMGASVNPTFYDWKMINIRYNCSESCSNKIECKNEGYQHPRNCNQCVCSDFYTGTYCETEKNLVELKENLDELWVRKASAPFEAVYQFSEYPTKMAVLKVPEGQKIRVSLNMLNRTTHKGWIMNPCNDCQLAGVEILDGDLVLTGKKFCCEKDSGYSFVSTSNVVGYRFYTVPTYNARFNVTFSVESDIMTVPPTTATDTPIVPPTITSTAAEATQPAATTVPTVPAEDTTSTTTTQPTPTTTDLEYCGE